jgi:short-subunit dehydrogenase
MPRELNDMVVVITGASAGIGRDLARALHAGGARLVLAARRMEMLAELNAELGGNHLCIRTDVSLTDDCTNLVERTIERFGRLDTLVANAGYGLARKVADTTNAEMHDLFRTNVFGTTDCIAAAVPVMRKNAVVDGYRGQVVIVSSAAGRRGLPWFGAYAATKSAQLGIAEALRVELYDDRIAVTSVHPIGTETEFFDVAADRSGVDVDTPGRSPIRQSGRHVANKMRNAIRRPCREVWPFWPARIVLALNALMPIVGDIAMRRALKSIERGRESKR